MLKRIISIVLISVMVLSLAACKKDSETGNIDSDDNSLQYILDNGKLIVGLDDSFPPMGFRDENNEIVGFDIDLAKAVSEKLGVELVLQPIDWDAKEQELATKSIDCIWNGLSLTAKNQENMTMTKSYMTNSITLVVKSDSDIASMADMEGKSVAVQSGSAAEETLDADENKDFKASLSGVNSFDEYTTALLDMESGSSDAVLMDSVVADYMINDLGKDYKVLDDTLLEDKYVVGFRKGDQALSDAVWNALIDLKEEGKITEISNKWFGFDITTIE
jgi:polar amino acid transport system substrate-binding protein